VREPVYVLSDSLSLLKVNDTRICLDVPLLAWTGASIRRMAVTLASPHRSNAYRVVQEFSACFPSPTPFGLGLGSDLPWEVLPCPGNLRFSANKFLVLFYRYSCRHNHF
jgi:hypothetical protein